MGVPGKESSRSPQVWVFGMHVQFQVMAGLQQNRLPLACPKTREKAGGKHHPKDAAHGITIDSVQSGAQTFHEVHNTTTGAVLAEYTFADGYLVVAPSKALLMDALETHASGNTLGRASSFKALLPADQNENYSAVAYQNLGPVLTPLLSQMNGESADAIKKLASDAHPTAICAWGKDARIEVASDSNLFGFDFLTLGKLLESQHKAAATTSEQNQ